MVSRTQFTSLLLAALLGSSAAVALGPVCHVSATVFEGEGLQSGLEQAQAIKGPVKNADFVAVIVSVIETALKFVTLLAIIFVIIAGIRFIISMGEEEKAKKARTSIIHVIIGLLIILLSQIIVAFVSTIFSEV
ncbi:MAG: hypothetical protein WCS85_03575 [Candidatus Peribacteraceae bacterium]|jgi:hypothetical protein